MRTFVRPLAAIALLLALAAPVLAKEGFQAQLDRAIPRTADPGTTITVGFTVQAVADPQETMAGTPLFFRVLPLGGDPIEDMARQDGGGHYTATFLMPAHGIVRVEAGVKGENCVSGTCQRSDLMLPITGPAGGDIFAAATVAASPAPVEPVVQTPAAAPAQAATGGTSDATTTTSTGSNAPLPVAQVALLGALAIGSALVGGAIAARRSARPI